MIEKSICTLIICAGIFCVFSITDSDWYKQKQAVKAEKERKEATPHVVRETDGCKVYAFKSGGRDHYFTRCPESRTTTTSTWDECHGTVKMRTCNPAQESIEATTRPDSEPVQPTKGDES